MKIKYCKGTLAEWKARARAGETVENDPLTPEVLDGRGEKAVLRDTNQLVQGWAIRPQMSGGYVWVKRIRNMTFVLYPCLPGKWFLVAHIGDASIPVHILPINDLIPMTAWLTLADRAAFWFRMESVSLDEQAEELLQRESGGAYSVISADAGACWTEVHGDDVFTVIMGQAVIRDTVLGHVQKDVPFEVRRFSIESLERL